MLALLDEAAQRLRQSAEFLRGDEAPLLALGDVLLERGERLAAAGDAAGAGDSLAAALEEGYGAAARINARSAEAAVGGAEVRMQQARLAAVAGDCSGAAGLWAAAEGGYAAVLQHPPSVASFDFSERCDLRYNHACCLAQCGRLQEAAALLHGLLALGAVAAGDIRQDADLAGVVPMLRGHGL